MTDYGSQLYASKLEKKRKGIFRFEERLVELASDRYRSACAGPDQLKGGETARDDTESAPLVRGVRRQLGPGNQIQ